MGPCFASPVSDLAGLGSVATRNVASRHTTSRHVTCRRTTSRHTPSRHMAPHTWHLATASRHTGRLATHDVSPHGIPAHGMPPRDVPPRDIPPRWALSHGTIPTGDQRLPSDSLKPGRPLATAPSRHPKHGAATLLTDSHPIPVDGDSGFGD